MDTLKKLTQAALSKKKTYHTSFLRQILEEGENSVVEMKHRISFMIMFSQLYLKYMINFRLKVDDFTASLFQVKDEKTMTKKKKNRGNTTTIKRKKTEKMQKERKDDAVQLAELLAQELEKNAHTETPVKNVFSQILEKKSEENKLMSNFSSYSKEFERKNVEETFQEYKKIIGIGENVEKKRNSDFKNTRKKRTEFTTQKLKEVFQENIELPCYEEDSYTTNKSIHETRITKKEKLYNFDDIKLFIEEDKKDLEFNESKWTDYQKKMKRKDNFDPAVTQNSRFIYHFSPQSTPKTKTIFSKQHLEFTQVVEKSLKQDGFAVFQSVCNENNFKKKDKALLFLHVLGGNYSLKQSKPFGPILIERN